MPFGLKPYLRLSRDLVTSSITAPKLRRQRVAPGKISFVNRRLELVEARSPARRLLHTASSIWCRGGIGSHFPQTVNFHVAILCQVP